ncbi:efflux RND transporter periplasmic adaptor subunit [Adhaeribacter pallidiroseus]|uniref:p-hydroxybenzoic acid efflux pump subunit AaeA n=1 Tax=Adhaeribacter pallidiroseus TaxID=2072847 RepID=A0A369QMB9_9BACT|nr:efflux RND transporter periplasmic adaptor subunit [Adhaeribacter pallidiroseus]RDC64387.1 p-hydroxybenzoic acid efflux pump subunit AaeA [Adhaeribacter pallidiroseus]
MNRKLYSLPVAVIFALLLVACNKSKDAAQQNPLNAPVPVNAYTVSQEQVVGTDTYPGTVVALNEVELRPQVAGYITNMYVQDGQQVTKGQKLYEIDRTQYQATYNQAQANLRSAQANLERARQDAERYENLAKQDAVARQRVDYARAELGTAQAQVAAAQAGVSGASTNLRYSVITAPMSGQIGIAQVKVGSQVSPGTTLINTISADNPIAVDMVINESEVPRFARLQNKAAKDSTFTIQFSDGSVYPYPGKIQAIDRAINPQTGTLTVRVGFPNKDRQLIPGLIAIVRVRNADIGEQLVIPNKAVTEQMGEYYAYVIQGDSVVQNKVALGSKVADKVVIREGLKAGDKVVVEGTQKLRPGAKITLGTPQPAPGAAASR